MKKVPPMSFPQEEDITDQRDPERNLLAAILSRAICDCFGDTIIESHFKRSARRWIFERLNPAQPFTFAWTVIQLDMDPIELQRTLKEDPSDIKRRMEELKL